MKSYQIDFVDLGTKDYRAAWQFQEQQLKILQQHRQNPQYDRFAGWFYVLEHPHVITLGKNGKQSNLLLSIEEIRKKGIDFVQTNRGGDITYHGPGQIVGYPIIDLYKLSIGVKDYVYLIEETIIRVLHNYGLKGERIEKATGVWLIPSDLVTAKKICSIGIRVAHGITMHGFAFNVNTDLTYFSYIHPCGFTHKGVTSLQQETNCPYDIGKVKMMIYKEFMNLVSSL